MLFGFWNYFLISGSGVRMVFCGSISKTPSLFRHSFPSLRRSSFFSVTCGLLSLDGCGLSNQTHTSTGGGVIHPHHPEISCLNQSLCVRLNAPSMFVRLNARTPFVRLNAPSRFSPRAFTFSNGRSVFPCFFQNNIRGTNLKSCGKML